MSDPIPNSDPVAGAPGRVTDRRRTPLGVVPVICSSGPWSASRSSWWGSWRSPDRPRSRAPTATSSPGATAIRSESATDRGVSAAHSGTSATPGRGAGAAAGHQRGGHHRRRAAHRRRLASGHAGGAAGHEWRPPDRAAREDRARFADNVAFSRGSPPSAPPSRPRDVIDDTPRQPRSPPSPGGARRRARRPMPTGTPTSGGRAGDRPSVVDAAPGARLVAGRERAALSAVRRQPDRDGAHESARWHVHRAGELSRERARLRVGPAASGDSGRRARARGGARGQHVWPVAARRRVSPRDPAQWDARRSARLSRPQPGRRPRLARSGRPALRADLRRVARDRGDRRLRAGAERRRPRRDRARRLPSGRGGQRLAVERAHSRSIPQPAPDRHDSGGPPHQGLSLE